MRKKLIGYMLLLAALLLLVVFIGLFLVGRYESASKSYQELLEIQMAIFEKDTSAYWESLAAESIDLSEHMRGIVEQALDKEGISPDDLNGSGDRIAQLQDAMIEPLKQRLGRQNCSGILVLLDATMGGNEEKQAISRTGLYLQQSRYQNADESILLYRGIPAVGKAHGIMPHGKWRQEFHTDLFPNYDVIAANAALPLHEAYMLTDCVLLPGTGDNVVLMAAPMVDSSGRFLGICGYEVSANYFMSYHTQPTMLSHLVCLLSPAEGNTLYAGSGLHCCGTEDYTVPPQEKLHMEGEMGSFSKFIGESSAYVGIAKSLSLSPNNLPYTLSVMIPKADYDRAVFKDRLQNLMFLALLLFFAVTCCLYMSRRYLIPISQALESIRQRNWAQEPSAIPEIKDLFEFLAGQDSAHEAALDELEKEKQQILASLHQVSQDYSAAQQRNARLAYSRKSEVDPDDYEMFLTGLATLSPMERKVFNYYLEGKGVKEIVELSSIKESTVRFHNRNIYAKLGVKSLRQLLLYAAVMRESEKQAPEA